MVDNYNFNIQINNDKHIHFIEGIPGSGKSTVLISLPDTSLYNRYFEHELATVIDVTRKAFLTTKQYEKFISDVTPLCKRVYGSNDYLYGVNKIHNNTIELCGYKIIALETLGFTNKYLNKKIEELSAYEISGQRVPLDKYFMILKALFDDFLFRFDNDIYHFFEGALLQNILFDLVGAYQLTDEQIFEFYDNLIEYHYKNLFEVDLLCVDNIENIIKKAARERVNNSPLWIDSFINCIEQSPYGNSRGLTGINGVIEFCSNLQEQMIKVCKANNFDYKIIYRRM